MIGGYRILFVSSVLCTTGRVAHTWVVVGGWWVLGWWQRLDLRLAAAICALDEELLRD